MQKVLVTGILILGLAASSPLWAQTKSDEVAQLKERVTQLEKQVREISQLVEPLKAQQATDNRRKALRENFNKKMQQDQAKYTPEQLRDAEGLYQVANQKWGTPEATESLKKMIEKYPDINRTGCAVLYIAQKTEGADRAKYLQDCIDKYGDCFYGDGAQVGVLARCYIAYDYKKAGDTKKADALFKEIMTNYPDAVDHSGKLLSDTIKALKD